LQTKKIPIADERGNPQYILGISEDITDKKKVEKELLEYRDQLEELVKQRTATLELAYEDLKLARDEAVRATNIKSEFLANMSHELRTPLNSIIGFTGVVKDEVAGPLNHEQKKQLGMAYDSARHLLSLINDILDISKVEAGKVEFVKQEFDYTKLLDETIDLIRPLAKQKGLTITINSECSGLPISSDKGKIKQVLINLLSNALKFTRQGNIAISCRDEGKTISTTITDTGEGIKAEFLRVIFEPFKQIDSGDVRPHQGTGLGLAICKKFMELLGGSISVVSTEGEGSRFTIELPKGR
jgi:signal transduction histidine kinase